MSSQGKLTIRMLLVLSFVSLQGFALPQSLFAAPPSPRIIPTKESNYARTGLIAVKSWLGHIKVNFLGGADVLMVVGAREKVVSKQEKQAIESLDVHRVWHWEEHSDKSWHGFKQEMTLWDASDGTMIADFGNLTQVKKVKTTTAKTEWAGWEITRTTEYFGNQPIPFHHSGAACSPRLPVMIWPVGRQLSAVDLTTSKEVRLENPLWKSRNQEYLPGWGAFSWDGSLYFCVGVINSQHVIEVWQTNSLKPLASWVASGVNAREFIAIFTPGKNTILTSTEGGPLQEWNPRNGALLRTLDRAKDKHAYEGRVRVSPDGQTLVRFGPGIARFEARTGRYVDFGEEAGIKFTHGAFVDINTLILAAENGHVLFWNVPEQKKLAGFALKGKYNAATSLSVSPNGSRVALGTTRGEIVLMNVTDFVPETFWPKRLGEPLPKKES